MHCQVMIFNEKIMKTIGLLGGTGWISTVDYYCMINQLVSDQLGGYHSAQIILKSIDYHDIMYNYNRDQSVVYRLFKEEMIKFMALSPESMMVCCNSLHKFIDQIIIELDITIPVFHAVNLTAQYLVANKIKHILLMASAFTMKDGFFAKKLQDHGIQVTVPSENEILDIQIAHVKLLEGTKDEDVKSVFQDILDRYSHIDTIVSACTEFQSILMNNKAGIAVVDPMMLQIVEAVRFSLDAEVLG